ncbi:unnamed protein product, partial [Ectocarpus fasciculatus]
GNSGRSSVPQPPEAAVDDGGGGGGGKGQRSRDESASAAARAWKEKAIRKSLPTPRYGRVIPEGSPPRKPSTLSPDFPFQGSPPPSPSARPSTRAPPLPSQQPPTSSVPQHFVPYP